MNTEWKQRLRLTTLVLIVFILLGTLGAVIYNISGGNATPRNIGALQESLREQLGQ